MLVEVLQPHRGGFKMTDNLKTLKDIGLLTCILKSELRQEAIKWVKTIFKGNQDWIEFFNISEEDLK